MFTLRGGVTAFHAAHGSEVRHHGSQVTTLVLQSDADGDPDILTTGDLSLFVIHRDDRYGMRLRDKNSSLRRQFRGRRWFPVKPAYRIEARFVPYEPPREIAVPNILGHVERQPCPGYAVFTLHGREHTREPVLSDEQLFFIFRDATAKQETYRAGRFLYAAPPRDGKVILDFNKAYNPPCAFAPTPPARCRPARTF